MTTVSDRAGSPLRWMGRMVRWFGRLSRGETNWGSLWLRGREEIHRLCGGRMQDKTYFERLYREEDPWRYQTSGYEQAKYSKTLSLLPDRSFSRALEVGCSIGVFTEKLALSNKVGEIVALDISRRAAKRAAERCRPFARVRIEIGDFVDFKSETPFDLIICAEVLYYLWDRASDRHGVRQRLASLLMPGGILVVVLGGDALAQDWEGFLQEERRLKAVARHEFDDPIRPFRISLLQASPA